jgi:biopolymer transport protein TolR
MSRKIGLGNKKELNAELNLTPFIDLLSTCVCFLLITAVWIEIGSVEVKQSHGTSAAASKKISYDLDIVYKSPQIVNLTLKRNNRRVKTFRVKADTARAMLANLNTTLVSKVLNFKNKKIEIQTATITPRSSVDYGHMISTMDVLRQNNILNIGVLSAKGR